MYLFCLFMRVLLSWFPEIDWNAQPWTFLRLVRVRGQPAVRASALCCAACPLAACLLTTAQRLTHPHPHLLACAPLRRSLSRTCRSTGGCCRRCLASSTSRRCLASSSCRWACVRPACLPALCARACTRRRAQAVQPAWGGTVLRAPAAARVLACRGCGPQDVVEVMAPTYTMGLHDHDTSTRWTTSDVMCYLDGF